MVTAERIEKPLPIPAVYERPRREAGIRFAGLHTSRGGRDLYDIIFNRYAPKIPLARVSQEVRIRNGWADIPEEVVVDQKWEETGEIYQRAATRADGKKVEAGEPKVELVKSKELTMVTDPNTLWVGRLTDGLVWLGVVQSRKLLKDFLHNVPAATPTSGTSARCEMVFERGDRRFSLGPRILDEEPGEIANSPDNRRLERDRDEDLNVMAPQYAESAFEPRLRLYPDADLHYLMRGDRISFTAQGWPRPRTNGGEPYVIRFELRPPSEGSSQVEAPVGIDNTVRLI